MKGFCVMWIYLKGSFPNTDTSILIFFLCTSVNINQIDVGVLQDILSFQIFMIHVFLSTQGKAGVGISHVASGVPGYVPVPPTSKAGTPRQKKSYPIWISKRFKKDLDRISSSVLSYCLEGGPLRHVYTGGISRHVRSACDTSDVEQDSWE